MYVHKHMYIYAAAPEAAAPTMFMGLATGLVLRTLSLQAARSATVQHSAAPQTVSHTYT